MAKAELNLPALLDLKEKKSVTEYQTDSRIEEMTLAVTHGLSNATIVKDAIARWGVTRNTANAYLAKAFMELANHAKTHTLETRIAQRRTQLEALYEACMIEKDYKTAASVMSQMTKFDGLNAPEEHHHTVASKVAAMTPDQRSDRLKVLLNERQKFIDAAYTVLPEDKEKHEKDYEEAQEMVAGQDEELD